MSSLIRSTTRELHPYVHKLRLEARDGAAVEVQPAPLANVRRSSVMAKLIVAAVAGATLLLLLARELLAP